LVCVGRIALAVAVSVFDSAPLIWENGFSGSDFDSLPVRIPNTKRKAIKWLKN